MATDPIQGIDGVGGAGGAQGIQQVYMPQTGQITTDTTGAGAAQTPTDTTSLSGEQEDGGQNSALLNALQQQNGGSGNGDVQGTMDSGKNLEQQGKSMVSNSRNLSAQIAANAFKGNAMNLAGAGMGQNAGGAGGMGGLGNGMGGMGGMMSMPPQFGAMGQGGGDGFAGGAPASSERLTRVRVEVADVTLNSGSTSRLDLLEARINEHQPPPPDGAAPDFAWDRKYLDRNISGVTALEMPWNSRGPVPFRWLTAGSDASGVGDSLAVWMIIGQSNRSTSPDKGLDPLDPRPANMLGFLGSSIWGVRGYTKAQIAGIDRIDGKEVIRVAWISNKREGLRGMAWYAPKWNFALVRFDATLDPSDQQPPIHGRLSWRKQASGFVKVGEGLSEEWLPSQVIYEENEADLEGGAEPVYHNELRISFEDFQPDPTAVPAPGKLTIQGLDDKTGQFTALPPEVPAALIDRLKKAVQDSPFGPPSLEKTEEKPAVEAALNLNQPPPANPPAQPAGAGVPAPVEAPKEPAQPVDAAPAPAPAKPGKEDQAQVDDEIKQIIDRRVERMFKADPEVRDLGNDVMQAIQKYEIAQRLVRDGNDPAVKKAQARMETIKKRYENMWESKSAEFRKQVERAPEIAQARDEIAVLLLRREGKVAEVQKAEGQRTIARAVVQRNTALAKKQPALVSNEDQTRAEGELVVAEAEVGGKKAELAEAELLLKQVRQRLIDGENRKPEDQAADLDPNKKTTRVDENAVAILQARRDQAAAELQKAQAQKQLAVAVIQRNERLIAKDPRFVSDEERTKADSELVISDSQVSARKAELDEAEALLKQTKAAGATPRAGAKPDGPAPGASASTLAELRDAVELLEIQLLGKRTELRGVEAKVGYARTGTGDKGQVERALAKDEVDQKKVEVQEYEIRLKQAKRRVETEEARLKREIERAKARLDWSEKMVEQGHIPQATHAADQKTYDELMFQLDPKYVPPVVPTVLDELKPIEPKPDEAPKPALEVKISAEKARFSGQTVGYKIRVSNSGTTLARNVRVAAILPRQGGKLVALPAGAQFSVESRTLNWKLAEIAPGSSVEQAFSYATSTPGDYRAVAEVSSGTDLKVSDTFVTEVQGIGVIDLKITQQSRIIDAGKVMHYDVHVKNIGTKEVSQIVLKGKTTANLKIQQIFGPANVQL